MSLRERLDDVEMFIESQGTVEVDGDLWEAGYFIYRLKRDPQDPRWDTVRPEDPYRSWVADVRAGREPGEGKIDQP